MKNKKFDSELEVEELEDQLEEKLKSIDDKLDDDLKRVEKEIKKLKPSTQSALLCRITVPI
jgi:hypothetical protein